jgi:hypothetical protein
VIAFLILVSACDFGIRGIDIPLAPNVFLDAGASIDASQASAGADGATAADLAAPGLNSPAPDMLMLPSTVGDACNAACGGGLDCMTWLPTGYCSKACSEESDCPTGSSCGDIGGDMHYCLLDHGDADCVRMDLLCRDCGHKVCAPASFCDGC